MRDFHHKRLTFFALVGVVVVSGALEEGARADDSTGSSFAELYAPAPLKPVDRPLGQVEQKAVLVGHNVTPTTDTLGAGVVTGGNYALAVGLTNSLFIATSPWIWTSYNTANLHLKWATELGHDSRVGLFSSYFHSYASSPLTSEFGGSKVGPASPQRGPAPGFSRNTTPTTPTLATLSIGELDRYQWESASIHALYSYRLSSYVKTNFNLHYGYFWNDDFPYSIRMDPGSDGIRDQVDATALTEISLGRSGFVLLLETGGLGLNYLNPYLQLGTSLAYLSSSWLVQIGASATMQFREVTLASGWVPGRYDSRIHYSESARVYYYERYLQTAIHPEVQLQYFF